MPEMTQYAPGALCWTDLATTDQNGAKRFYSELFGWKIEDMPMGPGQFYSMAYVGGKDVAAMATMPEEERKMGVPPHWQIYFSVASADEAAAKAAKLGGKIVVPAFDVLDVGRMAVLQDPSGAMFMVWQAKQHIGAHRINEPGAMCWSELMTRNTAGCKTFYATLFGWNTSAMPMGDGNEYTIFKRPSDERGEGGMAPWMPDMPANVPNHWSIYFAVTNCDDVVKRATKMGGKTIVPATDIPNVGRFAYLADPQGAVFAILQPAMR